MRLDQIAVFPLRLKSKFIDNGSLRYQIHLGVGSLAAVTRGRGVLRSRVCGRGHCCIGLPEDRWHNGGFLPGFPDVNKSEKTDSLADEKIY